jgi:hypothetical protein
MSVENFTPDPEQFMGILKEAKQHQSIIDFILTFRTPTEIQNTEIYRERLFNNRAQLQNYLSLPWFVSNITETQLNSFNTSISGATQYL